MQAATPIRSHGVHNGWRVLRRRHGPSHGCRSHSPPPFRRLGRDRGAPPLLLPRASAAGKQRMFHVGCCCTLRQGTRGAVGLPSATIRHPPPLGIMPTRCYPVARATDDAVLRMPAPRCYDSWRGEVLHDADRLPAPTRRTSADARCYSLRTRRRLRSWRQRPSAAKRAWPAISSASP